MAVWTSRGLGISVIVLAHTKFKPCGMDLRGRGLLSLRQVQDTAARISKYLSVSVEVW